MNFFVLFQRRKFHLTLLTGKKSPFVLSVDGMLGKEAPVVLVNLSRLMAEKLKEPISHVCGWFNGRIAIAIARSYSRMIRGVCLPSTLWYREPY